MCNRGRRKTPRNRVGAVCAAHARSVTSASTTTPTNEPAHTARLCQGERDAEESADGGADEIDLIRLEKSASRACSNVAHPRPLQIPESVGSTDAQRGKQRPTLLSAARVCKGHEVLVVAHFVDLHGHRLRVHSLEVARRAPVSDRRRAPASSGPSLAASAGRRSGVGTVRLRPCNRSRAVRLASRTPPSRLGSRPSRPGPSQRA